MSSKRRPSNSEDVLDVAAQTIASNMNGLDDLENIISPEKRPVTGAVLTMPTPIALGPAALEPTPAPIYSPPLLPEPPPTFLLETVPPPAPKGVPRISKFEHLHEVASTFASSASARL